MKFATFTKSFQDWPIPVVCHRFREIGLDGLDLTVRRGGHIEPANAAEQLPLAVKAAQEAGVEILLLTTDITDPTPEAEKTLATASQLGITHFKLGYYRYTTFGTLQKQMDDSRQRIAAVAKLAKKHSILPCVHIHSGTFLPSHGTQLYQLIHDLPPGEVGAYADMLHMALEGGADGWRQGVDLLTPWLALVAVKNFVWQPGERDPSGMLRWASRVVPVADGVSPIPNFMAVLKQAKFDGVLSLHSEYQGSHSFKDLNTEQCLAQTAVDLKFMKQFV
ncbi:MAG: sugar phosphate isomerase/epimerase [Pirellulales bacterium]|nr:sugar phosphate isomerase/epimerase [Pirellulales bacterium]